MEQQDQRAKKIMTIIFYTARNLSIAAGLFSLIMSILLLMTYLQLKTQDPLASPAITTLLKKIEANPEDQALRDQIRALDLLARKAYFTSQAQLKTGGTLLLAGAAILAACLAVLYALKNKFPASLRGKKLNDLWVEQTLARKVIAASGGGLILLALLTIFLSYTMANDYFAGETPGSEENEAAKTASTSPQSEMPAAASNSAEKKAAPEANSLEVSPQQLLESLPYNHTFIANWPNFRGPGGFGIAYTAKAPREWDGTTGKNIRWKVRIPKPGFNSPVVWENLLFVSGADDKTREVFCFNADTGALLWRQPVNGIPGSPTAAPQVSPDTGFAASTMACDGERVFAIFPTGDLICFNFKGDRIWARNLGVPANHYGHASSLLTHKALLFIQYDQDQGSRLLALDTASGNPVWETERSDVLTSWSSPILVPYGQAGELILASTPFVKAYDPQSGKELWKVECLSGEVGSSPAYTGGRIFSCNQFSTLTAIKLDSQKISWQAYEDLPDAASMLAAGKFLIVPTAYGIVTCYDTEQGKVLWQQEFEQGFYSSPVLAGGLVYLMNRAGSMYVFKAGEKVELVATSRLGEPSDCTPAFVKNRIYIRGKSNLFCVEERE
jgi:outer membrane protein assembly factor BamB